MMFSREWRMEDRQARRQVCRRGPGRSARFPFPILPSQFLYHEFVAVEPGLDALSAKADGHVFENRVLAGDRYQLRVEFLAIDARRRVALRAGERASAQRAINVDRTVGDDL